jgi:Zn-dependent protease
MKFNPLTLPAEAGRSWPNASSPAAPSRALRSTEVQSEAAPAGEASGAEYADDQDQPVSLPDLPRRPRTARRWLLPLILFLVTCLSTFWAGVTNWQPTLYPDWTLANGLGSVDALSMVVRQTIVAYWSQGAAYMLAVLAILITHEMGHFVATVFYRIPASLPFFIPFPVTPIGTMGAVIGMEGFRANRREIFDIGLAGPLAGLLVCLPVLCYGILQLDMSAPAYGSHRYYCPLLMQWLAAILRPDSPPLTTLVTGQLNPWLMAGWVGLLITGLNMMPVSQLDGGHVVYAVFGSWACWIARGFILAAISYVVFAEAYIWALMVVLVIFIGVDHPPTADDSATLGWCRKALGVASLSIPVLCFPAQGLAQLYP